MIDQVEHRWQQPPVQPGPGPSPATRPHLRVEDGLDADGHEQDGLQQRERQALDALNRLAAAEGDDGLFFSELSTILIELAHARWAVCWSLHGALLRPRTGVNELTPPATPPAGPVAMRCEGLIREIVYGDEAICIGPRSPDGLVSEFRQQLDTGGADTAILLPWKAAGERLGAVTVFDSRRHEGFVAEDVAAVRLIVEPAGLIWQQRQLRARLRASQARESARVEEHLGRLSEIERVKSEIVGMAEHELKGPVGIIRGYLSMVEDGDLADGQVLRGTVQTLSGTAGELAATVDKMLTVARLGRGRLPLESQRVDLRRIVEHAAERTRREGGPDLCLAIDSGVRPVWVRGDPERLVSIVANLLDNAARFSRGVGEIRCRLRQEGGVATVTITDQGPGIAAGDIPGLFSQFGRVSMTEHGDISGAGLGLHLSRSLARLHGGDVSVRSVLGRGSTFLLELPLDADQRSDATAQPLETFGPAALSTCCRELRELGAGSTEAAAAAVLRYLSDTLVSEETGGPACALIRLFKVESFRSLPGPLRALAGAGWAEAEPQPDTVFVRLVASVGSLGAGSDPATGSGVSFGLVRAGDDHLPSPIVRWVLAERARQLELAAGLGGAPAGGGGSLLHVEQARGSHMVPDQGFVRVAGVRSVVGCVESLPGGEALALLLFSRAAIDRGVAGLLGRLVPSICQALTG